MTQVSSRILGVKYINSREYATNKDCPDEYRVLKSEERT